MGIGSSTTVDSWTDTTRPRRAGHETPTADVARGVLKRSSRARSLCVVGAIVVLALGLRFTPGLDRIAPLVESDYCYELLAADRLFEGFGPTSLQPVAPHQPWAWTYDWGFLTQWPVGYPALVCLVRYVIGGTSLEAARCVSILCCAAALVGWFLWVGTLVPRGGTRWVVAGLGASSAVPLALLLNPSTDAIVTAALPYLLFLTASLNRIDERGTPASKDTTARRTILLGLLSGGLFWFRYASVFVPVAIGMYLLLQRRRGRGSWKRMIRFSLSAATPIVLLLLVNSVFGATHSAAATLNLGSRIEPAFSPAIVADAWLKFTSLGYFQHRAIASVLLWLWPIVVVGIVLCVRPVRALIFRGPVHYSYGAAHADTRASLPKNSRGLRPAARGAVAERASRSASGRFALSACVVLSTLLMLVITTSLFGAKYNYVGLDRYYLPIRPLYFALFVSPLLLLRSRMINTAVVGAGMLAASWTVQVDWARAHQRAVATQATPTQYGQWARCFTPNPDALYSWLARRNKPGLVVVSNYHEYIALETGIPALPIPRDPAALDSWLTRIKQTRHVDRLDVLFVLDPNNRWRNYWIPDPSEIVRRFGLTEQPVPFDDCMVDVFVYAPLGVATGSAGVERFEPSHARAQKPERSSARTDICSQ